MGTHHLVIVGQSQPRPLLFQTPPSLVSLNAVNAAAPMESAMIPRPPPAMSQHITSLFPSHAMPHAPTPTRRFHLSCFDDAHAAVLPCSSLLGTGCTTPRIPEEPDRNQPKEPSTCNCVTPHSPTTP